MNEIRAKFEEIWPVPDDIYWDAEFGMYLGGHENRFEWTARLDTFTHCQEATKELLGIIEFMTNTLDDFIEIHEDEPNRPAVFQAVEITNRAKQIMEQNK